MKEKKLKKIVQLVAKQVREYEMSPVKKSMYTGDWAGHDEDVSEKLKTMLLNLLKYRNNINININDNSLSISTDNLSSIKKSRTNSSGLTKVSDDDYFSVEIHKETGFIVNKGYDIRSQYLDSKMYDEILPLATNKLREINSENFSDIWSDVMKESGLMRDNNIDELLKNINE